MTTYTEIPTAQERSWVMSLAMDKLRETGAAFMVGQYGFNGTCALFPAQLLAEAHGIAEGIENTTSCWTCICDASGVLWQAYVAMEVTP